MTRNSLNRIYFKWLRGIVHGDRYTGNHSYEKLLRYLHGIEFECLMDMDRNRIGDGLQLRHRFAYWNPEYEHVYEQYIQGPCTVLEMMIALAKRCEEDFMDDPLMGDRTSQWFWYMVNSLGLGGMYDSRFDERYVRKVIERFLDRDYEPDGKGGLFYVRDCEYDMRSLEIWRQLTCYLNTIV